MHMFIAALLGGLVQIAGTLVGKVLLSLGIGFVVYSGIDAALDTIKDLAFDSLAGVASFGPALVELVGVLQIGTCLNIVFSAYAARLVLAGVTGGALKRMTIT